MELRAKLVELDRERDFVREVVNASPAFFCVLDGDGRIVRFNDAVQRATGIDDDERARGKSVADVFVADRDRASVAALVAASAPGPHEHRWVGHDGAELVVEWSLTPIKNGQGEAGILLTGLDISERARHEDELRSSRMRLVEAGDAERRRLERNLHDGAQQRLVSLALTIRLARRLLETKPEAVAASLEGAANELDLALEELRELARGLHPAALTEQGLGPALANLAKRLPIEVDLSAPDERLPENIEATAYYIVSEALTNVVKHAQATKATVDMTLAGDVLKFEVTDDGRGGADPTAGSGILGLRDRAEAVGGTLFVISPPGKGTVVTAQLPLKSA
jgi:PAS domain S-box-containing protein